MISSMPLIGPPPPHPYSLVDLEARPAFLGIEILGCSGAAVLGPGPFLTVFSPRAFGVLQEVPQLQLPAGCVQGDL